ncbi:Small archaeal modifier protein 3 [uncultured archaeon]|nr:Small archaeal modifier protein 3 [uncultured archaeon]
MVQKRDAEPMQKIRVKLFANLREYTKTKEMELDGDTAKDVLARLCKKFPGLDAMIFKDGELQHHINVFLNGKNILELNGIETSLNPDDEIAIFPPVSGGLCSKSE